MLLQTLETISGRRELAAAHRFVGREEDTSKSFKIRISHVMVFVCYGAEHVSRPCLRASGNGGGKCDTVAIT